MESVHLHRIVEHDGEIHLTGLPCEKGQPVELFIRFGTPRNKRRLTAKRLLRSGLIGLWKDRQDLGDSAAYARQLREQAQTRDRI